MANCPIELSVLAFRWNNNESRRQSILDLSMSNNTLGLNVGCEGWKFLRFRSSGDLSSNMDKCLEKEPELMNFLVSRLGGYHDAPPFTPV